MAKEQEMVNSALSQHLEHGKVVLFTEGDRSIQSGKDTSSTKEFLEQNLIEFEERDLSQMSAADQHATRISLALETGSYQLPSIYFG